LKVLLCFIDPRVRKIRNDSSCPGIFSRTLRFYYVASSPGQWVLRLRVKREIEKFIIRQPLIGEKDDYDSENSWISDGLSSSSRRRRRGDGRWEVGEWREK